MGIPYKGLAMALGMVTLIGLSDGKGAGDLVSTKLTNTVPVSGEMINPPYNVSVESLCGEEVGRETKLRMLGYGDREITRATLYENNVPQELNPEAGFSINDHLGLGLSTRITKNEPGKFIYALEVEDVGGNVTRSNPITVEYSGKLEAKVRIESRSGYNVGNTAELFLLAHACPDESGIVEAILYEDGVPRVLKPGEGSSLSISTILGIGPNLDITYHPALTHQFQNET